LLSHITVHVLAMVGAVVLPPLMLLLPGLVVAWIARGFARIPHQQAIRMTVLTLVAFLVVLFNRRRLEPRNGR
jgi:uncharacterized membrane protein YozB (DUF420 family)